MKINTFLFITSLSYHNLFTELSHLFLNNSEVVEAARRDRRRANVRNQIHRATISNLIDEPDVIGEIESVYNNLMEEVVQLRNDKLSLTSQLQETNRSISCKNTIAMFD